MGIYFQNKNKMNAVASVGFKLIFHDFFENSELRSKHVFKAKVIQLNSNIFSLTRFHQYLKPSIYSSHISKSNSFELSKT